VILRAQGQALHARLDSCSGVAGIRLQKAEADKVTGKGKLNDRAVAVPARLVDDKRSRFHRVKMGLRIANAEQQFVARKSFNSSTVERAVRGKGLRRCLAVGRDGFAPRLRNPGTTGPRTLPRNCCAAPIVPLPLNLPAVFSREGAALTCVCVRANPSRQSRPGGARSLPRQMDIGSDAMQKSRTNLMNPSLRFLKARPLRGHVEANGQALL
jgi:hypothetical protein